MQLAGGKLIATLLGTLVIGGAVGAGVSSAMDTKDGTTTMATPSPVATTTAMPSASAVPAQNSGATTGDSAAIVAEVRRNIEAATVDTFKSARVVAIDGNYAVAVGERSGDSRPYALKKVNGEWVVLSESKGLGDPEDSETQRLINSFGFSQALLGKLVS